MSERNELAAALPVAAVALAVDVATMHGLVSLLGAHYLTAATAGFTLGVLVNYALSVRFVFRHRRIESRRQELAVFVLIGLCGLAINAAALAVAVEILGRHYLIGKTMASGLTFLFNFGVRRQLLFTSPGKGIAWSIKT